MFVAGARVAHISRGAATIFAAAADRDGLELLKILGDFCGKAGMRARAFISGGPLVHDG